MRCNEAGKKAYEDVVLRDKSLRTLEREFKLKKGGEQLALLQNPHFRVACILARWREEVAR